MKYVKKLAEKPIWNAGFVHLYDLSRANLNKESREETVTFIASECYGSEPTNRKKLYNKLLTEHCGKMTSSFEFVRDWFDTSLNGCLRNNPRLRTFENTLSEIVGQDIMTSACFNSIATFRIKVPIFIARQIMRHRSFSFQESSRRYQDNEKTPFEFWGPSNVRDLAAQHNACAQAITSSVDSYKNMVVDGVRPEIARCVIPQGAYTTLFMQGDLEAWANYFNIRMDAKAQKEHRDLARLMFDMLREYKPRFFEHLNEYVDNNTDLVYNYDAGTDRPDKWD